MSDCIFCKIVSGEIPSERIYEDENTFAFLDIKPNNPGHTLVLPKEHSENIFDISEENLKHVMVVAKKIATALKKSGAEGVNVISNNASSAGQIVFHTHIHVIPRFSNDGFTHWQGKAYEDGAMQKTGEAIRQFLV